MTEVLFSAMRPVVILFYREFYGEKCGNSHYNPVKFSLCGSALSIMKRTKYFTSLAWKLHKRD